jgi:hypothetical protein
MLEPPCRSTVPGVETGRRTSLNWGAVGAKIHGRGGIPTGHGVETDPTSKQRGDFEAPCLKSFQSSFCHLQFEGWGGPLFLEVFAS